METKQRLEKVFNLLGAIPVQNDGVDIMYAIRQELRAAFKELAETEEEKNGR